MDGLCQVDDAHDHGQDAKHDENESDQRRHLEPPSAGSPMLNRSRRRWGNDQENIGFGLIAEWAPPQVKQVSQMPPGITDLERILM
jgi:hypothetical protein